MSSRTPVYLGYTQDQLDAQYEQRTLVPGFSRYLEHWQQESARVRAELECVMDVAYGAGEAERLDIFPARNKRAPVHLHIHGGAWQRLSKEHAAFPARCLVPAGAAFAAVNFASAAAAGLDELVRQNRAALAWMHAHAADYNGDAERLYLSGHSSGAHLVAMLLAGGWRAKLGLPEDAVKGAVMVSGVYDLEPVRLSARNDYLRLDRAAARRNSPIHTIPQQGPPVLVAWGDGELAEFRRQGGAFAAAWSAAGNPVTATELARHNHFEMYSALGDPRSELVNAALAQMGLA